MSRPTLIRIEAPALDGHGTSPVTIDVVKFVALATKIKYGVFNPAQLPLSVGIARLVTVDTQGRAALTPRGEDLLASAHLLQSPPTPEPGDEPCQACHGTGEQALFISKHACDTCSGTGFKGQQTVVNTQAFFKRQTFE